MSHDEIDEVLELGNRTHEFRLSDTTLFYSKEDLQELVGDAKSIFLTARYEQNLAGFLMSRQITRVWASIDNIVVDSPYRGLGISKAVLSEFETIAKGRGVECVTGIVSRNADNSRRFWNTQEYHEGEEFVWIEKVL